MIDDGMGDAIIAAVILDNLTEPNKISNSPSRSSSKVGTGEFGSQIRNSVQPPRGIMPFKEKMPDFLRYATAQEYAEFLKARIKAKGSLPDEENISFDKFWVLIATKSGVIKDSDKFMTIDVIVPKGIKISFDQKRSDGDRMDILDILYDMNNPAKWLWRMQLITPDVKAILQRDGINIPVMPKSDPGGKDMPQP